MEPNLKIALAAPTGKAARRIAESIQAGTERLDCPAGLKEKIPHEASTLHRLLGFSTGSTRPRYRMGNPLNADVVVIDEASMADLALMANLVQALKEGSRLILLGDRNQLASVAAGYVLGDICDTAGPMPTLRTLQDWRGGLPDARRIQQASKACRIPWWSSPEPTASVKTAPSSP
jgi:exodeoxyribonuclease V alpha subunit